MCARNTCPCVRNACTAPQLERVGFGARQQGPAPYRPREDAPGPKSRLGEGGRDRQRDPWGGGRHGESQMVDRRNCRGDGHARARPTCPVGYGVPRAVAWIFAPLLTPHSCADRGGHQPQWLCRASSPPARVEEAGGRSQGRGEVRSQGCAGGCAGVGSS